MAVEKNRNGPSAEEDNVSILVTGSEEGASGEEERQRVLRREVVKSGDEVCRDSGQSGLSHFWHTGLPQTANVFFFSIFCSQQPWVVMLSRERARIIQLALM